MELDFEPLSSLLISTTIMQVKTYPVSSQRPTVSLPPFAQVFSNILSNTPRNYTQTTRPRVLPNAMSLVANQASINTRIYATPCASRPGSLSHRPSNGLSPSGLVYAGSPSLSSRKTFRKSSFPTPSPKQERRLCRTSGCGKCMRRGGYCFEHGGGRICSEMNCGKSVQTGNRCFAHGALNRCQIDKCKRMARDEGLCRTHHIQMTPKPFRK